MFWKTDYEMELNARHADLERQAELAKQAVIDAHKEYERICRERDCCPASRLAPSQPTRICRERDCWPDFNFGGYGVRYDAGN